MPKFNYSAKQKSGKILKGTITAGNRADAAGTLVKQGLQPLVIKRTNATSGFNITLWEKKDENKKVKTDDRVIFTRQLATMINAGVTLPRAISTLQDQTDSAGLKAALYKIESDVQSGKPFADALEKHPKIFSSVYVNMVRAGEAGGILDGILNKLAAQQEKDASIKGKMKSAMIYPGVIITVTIGAFVFLMTSIVPKLGKILEDMGGGQLPVYTRALLAISDFMTNNILILLGGTALIGFAFIRYIKTEKGRKQFHRFILKIPIFGDAVLKVNIARFSRTFGTLMAAGVSVIESLQVTANSLNNVVIQEAILGIIKDVRNGSSISEPLVNNELFPQILGQMIAVGEETGEIEQVLPKLAEFYEEEVDRFVEGISSIIEPIMIIVLGVMVGTIVAAVFGPLTSITTAV